MPPNPFDPPRGTERSEERTSKPSGWWIAVGYAPPLIIVMTMMNEAGWYGTGPWGLLQGWLRVIAFFSGMGSAYYVLIWGTGLQKLAAAPAALGYSALVLGIVWDHYL